MKGQKTQKGKWGDYNPEPGPSPQSRPWFYSVLFASFSFKSQLNIQTLNGNNNRKRNRNWMVWLPRHHSFDLDLKTGLRVRDFRERGALHQGILSRNIYYVPVPNLQTEYQVNCSCQFIQVAWETVKTKTLLTSWELASLSCRIFFCASSLLFFSSTSVFWSRSSSALAWSTKDENDIRNKRRVTRRVWKNPE